MWFCMFFDVVIEAERTTKQHCFCDSEALGQIVITIHNQNSTRMEFQTILTIQRFLF